MSILTVNQSKQTARLAGWLYLVLAVLGYFGYLYVPEFLVVPGDMGATLHNIAASESMYRLSMVSTLLMNIVSILIVLLLYKLLKPAGETLAEYMVVFLVIGAGISMINEVNHFAALALSSTNATSVFTASQSQFFVQFFLDMQEFGAYIATIFWGLWLFPLGILIIKSNYVPKILGVLLIVAGVGYLVDSMLLFLAPQFGFTFTDYTFIGEILFLLWLLIKGVNVGQGDT